MSKKALTLKLQAALEDALISPEPLLAAAYRAAVMSVCAVDYVYIGEWDYPKFTNRQHDLDDEGIEYSDYAASVVKTWWGWCKMHGMLIVSAPIFCGPKAFARYKRDLGRHKHVEIDTLADDVHHMRVAEESIVAQVYVGWYPSMTLDRVRNILRPAQTYPPEPDVAAEVLDLMNMAYGFDAESYKQLASDLLYRREYDGGYNSS